MKRDQGLLFNDMYLCVTLFCFYSTKVIYMSFTCYLINPDIECPYFSIKGKNQNTFISLDQLLLVLHKHSIKL